MIKEAMNVVAKTDPEIAAAIEAELARQRDGLELIASENVVSEAVLFSMGSILTNKYAEGYPGRRYYGGCECVDVTETIAIERAKKLFGAEHANVQPHSGAQANTAVYLALLQHGDTVMGMNLAHHDVNHVPTAGILTDEPITTNEQLLQVLREGNYDIIRDEETRKKMQGSPDADTVVGIEIELDALTCCAVYELAGARKNY